MESKDILKFLEEYVPSFSKNGEKFCMFSVPTQHIYGDSIEELIEHGIETAKKQNGKSPFGYVLECIENQDFPKAESPQCFTVNFLPKSNEYELWIGNQPYFHYEKLIELEEKDNSRLRERVKELEAEVERLKQKNLPNDRLKELLKGAKSQNRHDEIDFGIEGNELI